MSTKKFQIALAKIIADPALCKLYHQNPSSLSRDYDLTGLEHKRLVHMIAQQRMKVNSMLYQMNRFTPLVNFMPYTVKLLDADIEAIVREFWSIYDKSPFQFSSELALFTEFIRQKIHNKSISVPYLENILVFEEAFADIRFKNMEDAPVYDLSYNWVLHSSARIIYMDYDAFALLDAVVDTAPGDTLPIINAEGGHYILKYVDNIALTAIPEEVAQYFTMGYPVCDDALLKPLVENGFVAANTMGR